MGGDGEGPCPYPGDRIGLQLPAGWEKRFKRTRFFKKELYWAEKNLGDDNVDLVGLGRQSLADPLFVKMILSGEIEQVHFCVACGGCSTLLKSQKVVGCSVYDPYYKEVLKQTKKS